MTGIKLSERIRYLHCEDGDETHGILVLLGNRRHPTKLAEVGDQTQFRWWFSKFAKTEEEQRLQDLALIAPRQLAKA